MILPLIVNPEAEADLAEAKAWYDGRQPGLGDEFLLCVDEAFQGIRQGPELHPRVFQRLRIALVRRFPFSVIYRQDDDQITVLAVYHTRRDPRGWRNRA
ncbi:type II toxin-antitoxin system RelE/ParE family toxin [Tundrisphaera sp. TA3]|uniref:type II toxin-antitoxin system RelE/ParE family toxin n=1 Tax=Tundrisphaera sp. TA3 TaxID=3435775 RepID=UPI003EB9C02E